MQTPASPHLPEEASAALSLIKSCLGDGLLAIYLHGSITGSGLRRHSDIDLIAIVNDRLTAAMRKSLVTDLMAVSGRYPVEPQGRRPLEVIIFHAADVAVMPYPLRAELVYGEWLRATLESGAVPEAETSPEFTLLLAQARKEAIPLTGSHLADLMPRVPFADLRRASQDLLPSLAASARDDARNVILTLARMWRTVAIGDFLSKNAAADWTIPRSSRPTAQVIAAARDAYLGDADEPAWLDLGLDEAVTELNEQIRSLL